MSKINLVGFLLLAGAMAIPAQVPPHRAKQITEAAPSTARVAPRQPRRVLIWNTPPHLMGKDPHKGYCIPYGEAAFVALGKKTGAFEPVVSDDLAQFLPENLRRFDAVVMNNSSGAWITPTETDLRKAAFQKHGATTNEVELALRQSLLEFVRGGGGVVAIHYAIAANRHWPEFRDLFGATFTGHPWNEEVGVKVDAPGHPLVAAYDSKGFRITDEIYEYGPPYDRARLLVLLSLDIERTNMRVPWIKRKDNDFALAWVKPFGKGRVFYTAFGHRTELFWDARLLRFYLDGIQFATGDLAAEPQPAGKP